MLRGLLLPASSATLHAAPPHSAFVPGMAGTVGEGHRPRPSVPPARPVPHLCPKWDISGSPLQRNRSGRLPATAFWASKVLKSAFSGSCWRGRRVPGSSPQRAACLRSHRGPVSPGSGSCSTACRPPDHPCRFPAPGLPSPGLQLPATQPPAPAAMGQLAAWGPCKRGATVTRQPGRPCVGTPRRSPWRPWCVDAVELHWKPGSPCDTTAPLGRKPGDSLLTSAREADASSVTGTACKLLKLVQPRD